MTQRICVIGDPLKHTLSHVFQQAAFDYYQLDIRYEVWETRPEDLESALERLRKPQNLGANITVPYKERVLHLIDKADSLADQIGAVNTIVNRNGKLIGFNTDAKGFMMGLRIEGNFVPSNKKVVVLGAGGAARAVTFALAEENVNSITVVNRTLERSEALVSSLERHALKSNMNCKLIAVRWHTSEAREALRQCHMIVNCTTIGMSHSAEEGKSPLEVESIHKGVVVYDLVYNPMETPLLRLAKEAGAVIVGGLPMLVYQGAAAFSLWTGKDAPVDIMYKAARQALQKMEHTGS